MLSEEREDSPSIRYSDGSALWVLNRRIGIDAERMKDGGMEIGRSTGEFQRCGADAIGFSVDLSAFDARPGIDDREAVRIVVASRTAVDARRSTKIGQGDDQGFIEHVSIRKVVEQCREGAIVRRQHIILEPIEVVAVRIPVIARRSIQIACRHANRHHRDAHFNQPAGQQNALAADMLAVAVAELGILTGEIQRRLDFGTQKQFVGQSAKALEVVWCSLH